MTTLPPPPLGDAAAFMNPHQPPSRSRRRAGTLALTTGLLIGGVAVGSQFAAATSPAPSDGTPEPAPVEAPTDDADNGQFDADFEKYDDCLFTELGLEGDQFDDTFVEPTEEQFQSAEEKCEDLLPEGAILLGEVSDAAFEKFDTCIAEQFGEEFDFSDGDFDADADVYLGGVFVDAGENGDGSFYDFGEGDGTITISKADGEISVTVDGDISEQQFEMFDEHSEQFDDDGNLIEPELTDEEQAAHDDFDAKWEAAEQACSDLLPEGTLDFDAEFDGDETAASAED